MLHVIVVLYGIVLATLSGVVLWAFRPHDWSIRIVLTMSAIVSFLLLIAGVTF